MTKSKRVICDHLKTKIKEMKEAPDKILSESQKAEQKKLGVKLKLNYRNMRFFYQKRSNRGKLLTCSANVVTKS